MFIVVSVDILGLAIARSGIEFCNSGSACWQYRNSTRTTMRT
jgi:hypothetical protein